MRPPPGFASRTELEAALRLAARGELRTDMGMNEQLLQLLERVALAGRADHNSVRLARRLRDEMEAAESASR